MGSQPVREVDTLLARFPGPVTLHPSKLMLLVGLLMCAGFTAFSVFLLRQAIEAWTSEVLWAGGSLLLFAAATIRLVVMLLLPGAAGLTLNADGFTVSGILERTRWRWRDVSGFRVEDPDEPGWYRTVVFDGPVNDAWWRRRPLKRRGLPANYTVSVDDLAWLMAQWRERALAQPHVVSTVPHIGAARSS